MDTGQNIEGSLFFKKFAYTVKRGCYTLKSVQQPRFIMENYIPCHRRTPFAKFTRPFLKQIKRISETEYCRHAHVIGYARYAEKGKAVVKKTSEISRIAGISRRTLQFYDDEGVVKAERSEINYRLYNERALGELWEVMIYKEAGMELKEIKELMRVPEQEKKLFYQMYIKSLEEEIKKLEGQKKWVSFIMDYGLPSLPEEDSGITYKRRIARLSGKEGYLEAETCEKTEGRGRDAENLKKLRYLLDEAYQQMQKGQLHCALYDAGIVMREAVEMILRCQNNGYMSDNLLENMKICQRRKLFGTDKGFAGRLYDVYHICECDGREDGQGQAVSHRKVYFAIMQLKDLLNLIERNIISEK